MVVSSFFLQQETELLLWNQKKKGKLIQMICLFKTKSGYALDKIGNRKKLKVSYVT